LKPEDVVKKVLKKIRPSREERKLMKEVSEKVVSTAREILSVYGAEPMMCGSVAKNTWIKPELDLFMLFNPMLPRKKLEEYGLRAAKEIIKKLGGSYTISYAEHPYVRGVIKFRDRQFSLDVVPCYKTDPRNIKSAVDRTPHHVRYVKERIKGLEDDARLLKKFCAARGCYGADVKTKGFSGYLCELLVIKYGRFLDVLKEITKWWPGVVITLETRPARKFRDPLVFIDPVDPKRNVAAAVSAETMMKLIKEAKRFFEHPSEAFFETEYVPPYTVEEVSKLVSSRGTRFYLIRFPRPVVQEDILYQQMERLLKRLGDEITRSGFSLMGSLFWCRTADCVVLLEAEVWQLPRIKKQTGPDIFSDHAREFLKRYSNTRVFIENGKWVAEVRREHILLMEFLKSFFSGKELRKRGVPSKLAEPISKKCEIASGRDSFRLLRKLPPELRSELRKYFEKDLNIEV